MKDGGREGGGARRDLPRELDYLKGRILLVISHVFWLLLGGEGGNRSRWAERSDGKGGRSLTSEFGLGV